ncbi:MAG TPA: hypothetical protein VF503_07840 [Sphingobium sp.]|uniref:hypothetical protein n=1 Tax=Sphingobium sp. TaxID=1912891 RepID=UPI002ED25DE0
MRLAFFVPLVVATSSASLAITTPVPNDDLARSIADFSGTGCYGIVSGAIAMPTIDDPNSVDKSIKTLEGMGLRYGVNDNMMKGLGRPGMSMISRSTMGSKSFPNGDVLLVVGGPQPGCRVILLSEPSVNVTEGISERLVRSNWKAVPSMTGARGPIERRAFVRRDSNGNPYLMNLMTITAPVPDSKLRVFTTTVRIPNGVQLPEGL